MKRVISYAVIAIFLAAATCLAAALDPATIVVPADSGRIVEAYNAPDPKAPLIVYLQDIHMNYESQKAEADVLEALIRDYGFDLVFLEAKSAGSDADFKDLRKLNTIEGRIEGADNLLKKGTISGVNYVDLTTDYSFSIVGVEDLALYKKETEDHMAIFGNRENISKLAAALQNIASNLKLHVYSKELRDLDEKAAAYNKDEIGLVEYVKFLDGAAKANSVDLKTLPDLALFIASSDMEGQIDFAAVETERETVSAAAEKANAEAPKVKEELAAKNMQFRTGEISQGAYYAFLKDAAETAKIDLTACKNLNLYTRYITTYEKIDTAILFKEIDQLVDQLKNALIKTPEQKKLSQVDKGLTVISDMVNTKLIPDEYNYYVSNKADFNLDDWLGFLKNNSAKYALTAPVPEDVSILKTNLPLLERFYSVSFERDNAFISAIKADLSKFAKEKAVFVCGGFHTPNMKKLLKENGFSYLIVAPKIDVVKNYDEIYLKRTQIDLEYLNKKFPATEGKR
ncbi:MAG: hypothetical protein NTV07_06355 [Candidatus Omnitrophica bacterium]|nr:hypothetical protein [Candidatus Omnitrophota bacterium]